MRGLSRLVASQPVNPPAAVQSKAPAANFSQGYRLLILLSV